MAPPIKRLTKQLVRREIKPLAAKNKPTRITPDLRRQPLSFVESAPDPMTGIKLDGTHQENMAVELNALQKGFRERAAAERFRFVETTKSDFYFTVVFEHGSQADEFIRAAGYRGGGDKKFVDGMMLAAALGIELPPSPFKLRKLRPADRSLRHLVTAIPKRSGLTDIPE